MTDFYVTDRQFNLTTIISTHGNSKYKPTRALTTSVLSTASKRMEMDLSFNKSDSLNIAKDCDVGNYVLYYDRDNKPVVMCIMKASHNPVDGIRTMELESGSMDLLNETTGKYQSEKAKPIADYINYFIYDSGFSIGINEIADRQRRLEWDGEATTLDRVLSVATQFDAELEFRFELSGNQVVKWIIDIRNKVGYETDYKLYLNKDINSITTETDIYSLYNASRPTGGTLEGEDKPIDLKGYTWRDPNGRFYLDPTTGIIHDKQTINKWRRAGTTNGYFLQSKTYTATSKETLIESAISDLKKYSEPLVNYIVDIAHVPFNLNVGDYIYIVDETDELFLNSRVQQDEYNHLTKSSVVTLGDFLIVDSGISQALRDMANDFTNQINSNVQYTTAITTSEPFFINGEGTITMTAHVLKGTLDVTSLFHSFEWVRYKLDGTLDSEWSASGTQVTVTADSELRYTYEFTANNN